MLIIERNGVNVLDLGSTGDLIVDFVHDGKATERVSNNELEVLSPDELLSELDPALADGLRDMSRVILMHGGYDEPDYRNGMLPSASNRQWLPWVQNQLLIGGYDAQTPEVFRSHAFEYALWTSEFERHLDDAISLVGHSTGAGFFLRWLSENSSVHIDKLILVAPYIDPFNAHENDGFFDFELDSNLPTRVNEIHVFHSVDDMPEIVASVDGLLSAYPVTIEHRYEHMGHFTTESMGSDSFPDLVEIFVAPSIISVQSATSRQRRQDLHVREFAARLGAKL